MENKKRDRQKAIELRKAGMSLNEIVKNVNASKTSVSLWVREVVLSDEKINKLKIKKEINIDELIKYIKNGFSQRKIAKILGVSDTCIRRCLKEEGIKTERTIRLSKYIENCSICGRKTKNKKICQSCRTKIRRIRTKWAAIQLLGGKCSSCGKEATTETLPCYEFHHKDDIGKEFNIGSVSNKSWNSIKEEIKKCEILCSNCHRLKHSGRDKSIMIYAITNYKGNLLTL